MKNTQTYKNMELENWHNLSRQSYLFQRNKRAFVDLEQALKKLQLWLTRCWLEDILFYFSLDSIDSNFLTVICLNLKYHFTCFYIYLPILTMSCYLFTWYIWFTSVMYAQLIINNDVCVCIVKELNLEVSDQISIVFYKLHKILFTSKINKWALLAFILLYFYFWVIPNCALGLLLAFYSEVLGSYMLCHNAVW